MSYVGINVGALTVKGTARRGDARSATVPAHQGRPLEILDEVLAGSEFADAEHFKMSGQVGHISEVARFSASVRIRPVPAFLLSGITRKGPSHAPSA